MMSITLTNMDVIIINHVETPHLIAYDFIINCFLQAFYKCCHHGDWLY